jgi:hypothetical protein
MKQERLTIEENENGGRVLTKCAEEAVGEVVIPEGVTAIGNDAFKGCKNVTSLIIPEGMRFISSTAFGNLLERTYCPSLATIHFPSNAIQMDSNQISFSCMEWYKKQPEGVVYAGANVIGYKGTMPEDTELVIKEGTKTIASSAFQGNNNIKKVVLPNSLQYIFDFAFRRCNNLVAVLCADSEHLDMENGESMASKNKGVIYTYAFCDCESLRTVHVPSAIAIIQENAFQGCKNLDTFSFPARTSIESIGESKVIEDYAEKDLVLSTMVFDEGFPKKEKVFANRYIGKLYVNDKSKLKSFPKTNQTFKDCRIKELWINLAKKNCDRIPEDILSSLHLDNRNYAGRIIYAAPDLCEEASAVPGYIRVTKALLPVPLEEGDEHDGDVFDINTKYIISVEPIDIERYPPVKKGSRIRCASNAYERGVEYCVYEPYDMVLVKIEASLRMLSEQVGGVAGLLNQLETLVKPKPIVIKD